MSRPLQPPTYAVDRLKRTVAPHGLTGAELKRLRRSAKFIELYCRTGRSELMWLSTSKQSSRSAIAAIWKRITVLQKGFDLPVYSVLVFETRGGSHVHIIFLGNPEIAVRLRRANFGELVKVELVPDLDGLLNYLAKERTPQAGYRQWHRYGGRLSGSHRLEGGGDRVRLSRELERDAIEAGRVEPWQHTNAKRSSTRKERRLEAAPTESTASLRPDTTFPRIAASGSSAVFR